MDSPTPLAARWTPGASLDVNVVRSWVGYQDPELIQDIATNLICAIAQGEVIQSVFGYEYEEGWVTPRRFRPERGLHPVGPPRWTCLSKAYRELFLLIAEELPPVRLTDFNELDERNT